ncbi:MAG: L-aspartate oxidase [Acidobacteriota bacterium]
MRPVAVRTEADEVIASDVLVVGSGIAGLTAALGLLPRRVTVLTKTDLGAGSSSQWAQGGVAAAMAASDSPRLHAEDTISAGAGLGEKTVIEILTEEGPARIRQLIELGARFDRGADGQLLLGREGAHGRRRILHAGGDATGAEMVRALAAEVRRHPGIDLWERTVVHDLVMSGERVVGVLASRGGKTVFHRAAAVVLATGGLGQLFARTTNPLEATGDGLAMAARAGAQLVDLEMIQFHPTALEAARDLVSMQPLPLVTEALRGEGAVLIDDRGQRFMVGMHEMAELGPRDVVARAILARQKAGQRVFLDAREALAERFPERFPTVWQHCQSVGIDPRRQPIPVTPAAHYAMAGIAVDGYGQSSLPGLWACGEVSSTGIHGANRLASNSLLEALVFGARVAEDLGSATAPRSVPQTAAVRDSEVVWREFGTSHGIDAGDERAAASEIRGLMWQHAGLERYRQGLETSLEQLASLGHELPSRPSETRNLMTLGSLVTAAALAREESRGSHYRSDFPTARERFAYRFFWTYRPGTAASWRSADEFPLVAKRPTLGAREIA